MSKYYPTKMFVKNKSIWSVYKGEEEIAFGTFDEIEKQLGIKRETTYCYVSKTYLNKNKNNPNKICFVLVEPYIQQPIDYHEIYRRRMWKSEYRKSK